MKTHIVRAPATDRYPLQVPESIADIGYTPPTIPTLPPVIFTTAESRASQTVDSGSAVTTTDAAVVSIGAFQGQLPNPNNYPYLMREMNSYGGDYITVLRQGSAGRVIIGDLNFRLPIQWWNSFRYGQGLSVVQPAEARGAWDTPLNQEEYLTLVQDPNIFWDQYWPAIQSRSGLSGLMGVGMGGWA
jgi:hypothetical protein